MKEFNVIIYDFNKREFIPYNVIPYLIKEYEEAKEKPKTFDEFEEFIKRKSLYQWWSRCEYEVILKSWPSRDPEKKIDVHWQVMMNIDIITEIIINEVNEQTKDN